jgi:uncharacterized protein
LVVPDLTVVHRPDLGRYQIIVDGELAGFSAYEAQGNVIAFMHTEIDPKYAGQGLAVVLVSKAMDDIQSRGEKILPFCPIVRSLVANNRKYLPLVPVEALSDFDLVNDADGVHGA